MEYFFYVLEDAVGLWNSQCLRFVSQTSLRALCMPQNNWLLFLRRCINFYRRTVSTLRLLPMSCWFTIPDSNRYIPIARKVMESLQRHPVWISILKPSDLGFFDIYLNLKRSWPYFFAPGQSPYPDRVLSSRGYLICILVKLRLSTSACLKLGEWGVYQPSDS